MRLENAEARNYYLHETIGQNWTVRTLERNLNSFYYERLLSSQALMPQTVKSENQMPDDFIKNPYVFEFLDLPEPFDAKESEIEAALIQNLQSFLLELGKGFSFVARQFRISTET